MGIMLTQDVGLHW